MATKRMTQYEKALRRLSGALVDGMLTNDEAVAQRAQRRADRWLNEVLQTHWENHPEDVDECDWCRRFPPLAL